ncbi:hypothetical protein GW626_08500 [Peribacillus muralis]|uniref:hypothetical protein n=1 Tax=Peribacillus muralis TaxID=264697 RepID=UPI001F4E3FF8|nr:hypothetical protein [Peribacillus muralis]MCK1995029.1 hypothetical protein [Peribacillus muralis]MCK2015600.1 hypothetical protein [Peribacillus muralis]
MRNHNEMDLTKDDILKMIVRHLSVFPLTSLAAIREVIGSSLKQRGLISGVTEHISGAAATYNRKISDEDIRLMNDCIYELLNSRIITPGNNLDHMDLPWIHVSDQEKLKHMYHEH